MLAETNVAAVQLYSVVMYTYRIATTLINQKFSVHVECRKSQLTHRAIWVGLVMSMFPRLLKKQLSNQRRQWRAADANTPVSGTDSHA